MNNFQEIEPRDTLPAHIKAQTMSSLGTLKLIMDMVDLFIVKGAFTLGQSATPGVFHSPQPQETPVPGESSSN